MDINALLRGVPPGGKKKAKVNTLLSNLMSAVSGKNGGLYNLYLTYNSNNRNNKSYHGDIYIPQTGNEMFSSLGLENPEYKRTMPPPSPDTFLKELIGGMSSYGNAVSNMVSQSKSSTPTPNTLDKNAVEQVSPLLAKLMFGGSNTQNNETEDNVTTQDNTVNNNIVITGGKTNKSNLDSLDTSDIVKRILSLKEKEYDIADKYNKFNLFQGVVDKFINDMTASRAAGSYKPLSYMPPGATAHMKATQTDPNIADRQTATVLRSLMASGATPAMLKSVLSEGMKMKANIEQSNRQSRQQAMQQNIASTADMVNRYNQAYTNTTNANIQMRNQLAENVYQSATKMSYANAEKIGQMLAGLNMNQRSRILQQIELLKSKYLKNNNSSSEDKNKEEGSNKYEPDVIKF